MRDLQLEMCQKRLVARLG